MDTTAAADPPGDTELYNWTGGPGNASYHDCLTGIIICNITKWPMYLAPSMTEHTVALGYATLFLTGFTLLTNVLVCVVLMKKNMRSPTNALLMAMAVSDLLTGVPPVPVFIHFHALGHYADWVPLSWCFACDVLLDYIPTIFHTASIWLTTALAVQRYIYVCHSIKAKRWCTMNNAIKVIVCTYVAAVVSQFCRFLENEYEPLRVPSHRDPTILVDSCHKHWAPFVEMYTQLYFNTYYWFRVIFIHMVPCISLMVLNLLLINAMRAAQRRREQLLQQNRKCECRRLKEATCTTLMLVAVVSLFLLVEFPQAILLTIMIVDNTGDHNVKILGEATKAIATEYINLFILLSYPVNFFIYCGMSRQFRDTFTRLFVCFRGDRDSSPSGAGDQSQYQTLPATVANGNGGAGGKTIETAI